MLHYFSQNLHLLLIILLFIHPITDIYVIFYIFNMENILCFSKANIIFWNDPCVRSYSIFQVACDSVKALHINHVRFVYVRNICPIISLLSCSLKEFPDESLIWRINITVSFKALKSSGKTVKSVTYVFLFVLVKLIYIRDYGSCSHTITFDSFCKSSEIITRAWSECEHWDGSNWSLKEFAFYLI